MAPVRPIDPLADSSQKSATKRSVLYHPLGQKNTARRQEFAKQQHQHPKTSYDTTLCHAFPVKVGHKLSDILLKPTIVQCASYPPSFLQVSCIQTYRSFSWLITDVSNQAFSWMSSFCHEESQKHTIKTPRMHVDKNRIDAVSTTAVSLPKKLQPVRCKVSLALHLTYRTNSMCSRQMAVQT